MSEIEELRKYIGKEFNEEIKKQIENQFKPYVVTTCTLGRFYCEDYWVNQIRCAVEEGKIADICFH
jgi:hypothetical protein